MKALSFSLPGDDGKRYALEDFKGKWLVLYFYPRDNTPGCTQEAKEFQSFLKEFEKLNAIVVGVSRDNCESHRRFRERQGLTFPLLCDEEAELIKGYGFWGRKAFGREGVIRSTVLISPDGEVVKVWKNVRARGHAEKVLSFLQELVGR